MGVPGFDSGFSMKAKATRSEVYAKNQNVINAANDATFGETRLAA
jgi:hypothetical protein